MANSYQHYLCNIHPNIYHNCSHRYRNRNQFHRIFFSIQGQLDQQNYFHRIKDRYNFNLYLFKLWNLDRNQAQSLNHRFYMEKDILYKYFQFNLNNRYLGIHGILYHSNIDHNLNGKFFFSIQNSVGQNHLHSLRDINMCYFSLFQLQRAYILWENFHCDM